MKLCVNSLHGPIGSDLSAPGPKGSVPSGQDVQTSGSLLFARKVPSGHFVHSSPSLYHPALQTVGKLPFKHQQHVIEQIRGVVSEQHNEKATHRSKHWTVNTQDIVT